MKKLIAIMILVMGAFLGPVLACGAPTQFVTLNLNTERVNQILSGSSDSFKGSDWMFTYDRVDLLDNIMRIHGSFKDEKIPAINGYVDIGLSVVEGALLAELLSANFGDFEPSEADVQLLVGEIEQALKNSIEMDRKGIQYVAVEMIKELIKLQIRFLPD